LIRPKLSGNNTGSGKNGVSGKKNNFCGFLIIARISMKFLKPYR